MLPAMGVILILALAGGPFAELRHTLFAADQQRMVDMLRFGVILPTCTAMLLVTYTRVYSLWLPFTAPPVAMIQGLCLIIFDLLMQRQGYTLSAVMPMLVLSTYMLFGMMHVQATVIATLLVAAYGISGWMAGLNSGQRLFDVAMSCFALLLGYCFHYSFARTQRLNWFRNMLLT